MHGNAMDKRLLDLLCCPVDKRPLKPIGRDQLKFLNAAIAAGGVVKVGGEPQGTVLTDALIREDGHVIYPVDDGIPVLLSDEAIGTTQFTDFPR
jgi:uncharacterized protein YbaR (Trm112 family)